MHFIQTQQDFNSMKFGSCVCCFRNPERLDECDIDEKTKEVLLENIKRRLTPQSVKIRAGLFPSIVLL